MRINVTPILSVTSPCPGIEVDLVPIPYWEPLPERPDPGEFCECRLPKRESPVCVRNRAWQVRSLCCQAQPSEQLFLHRPTGARAAHTIGARVSSNSGGNADDGGGGGPAARCSVCGFARCLTPIFCSHSRALDALRAAKCWGRA